MHNLIPRETLRIRFSGGRHGYSPVTYTQWNVLNWLDRNEPYGILVGLVSIPSGRTLADVGDSIQVLLLRHESLRTLYQIDAGVAPMQRLIGEGQLAAQVFETGVLDPVAASSYLPVEPIDVTRDFPVRITILTQYDSPALVVIYVSHVAADSIAMKLIREDFSRLLENPDSRVVGPRRHQPLDQAIWERSASAESSFEKTVDFWRKQLARLPMCTLAIPPRQGDSAERYGASLESVAVGAALEALCQRVSASPSSAILAAIGVMFTTWTGNEVGALYCSCHNRFRPHLVDYVGTIAQETLLPFSLTSPSFYEIIRQVQLTAIGGYRHGHYNSLEISRVVDQVSWQRGMQRHRDCIVNDVSENHSQQLAADPLVSRAELAALLPKTRIVNLSRWASRDPFRFSILSQAPTATFALEAASDVMGKDDVRMFLRAIEKLLVVAAFDDVNVTNICSLTELTPVVRGPGWTRLDNCWIDLAATRELVAKALPMYRTAVFVEEKAASERLIAYIAANSRQVSLAELHAACLAQAGESHGVMAPQRYIVCSSAPSDLQIRSKWDGLRVVAEGSGRNAPL